MRDKCRRILKTQTLADLDFPWALETAEMPRPSSVRERTDNWPEADSGMSTLGPG
ncbi:hypothetical protein [Trinickia fusca]|uniref:hypothetical protein n=1 Tax=Trinickia fusca TaxID=2419777 RepID=UPI001602D159|nr:hypothetical protein [Trinickia fusca]